MKRKSLSEQIALKQEQVDRCQRIILSEQEKLDKYIKELELLKSTEVMSIINEMAIPYGEVKELLMAKKAVMEGQNELVSDN